ncbi:MAG: hypothetical protein JSS43_12800 [Proteobacteria bacterium]|nr:hypothetical protein [Pseudomonadota bacterium]
MSAVLRFGAAGMALALLAWLLVIYPLPAWPLGTLLVGYAAVLWRWPQAFLLVMPVVLPGFDLGLWTGWIGLGEADPFVLVTLAVLLLRCPPSLGDCWPYGRDAVILACFVAAWAVAGVIGLLSPLGAEPSDNPYLGVDNALRLSKSLLEALALMPFLISRQRRYGDAVLLFGAGMAAGLLPVTLVVLAERAMFCGLWDFTGDYRATGQFTSMHVGGGHIGAYAALALPFTLALLALRPRALGLLSAAITLLGGGYTLAASMARTAYAAGVFGLLVSGFVSVTAGRRRSGVLALAPVVLCIAGLAAVAAMTGMRERFSTSSADLATREADWHAGLAVRDTDLLTTVFGMGLGTYQRTMLVRSPVNRPSDVAVRVEDGAPVLALRNETRFYLGQKVAPFHGAATVSLQARAIGRPNTLSIVLCDKVLLYSDNCRGQSTPLSVPGRWQDIRLSVPMNGLGAAILDGWLHRPVEFSLSAETGRVELRALRVINADGWPMLANAEFRQGLDRWLFTDDSHVPWRMKDVYLMLFFEAGVLGLAAYVALAGAAILSAAAAARAGVAGASSLMGAVSAFLVSGLFDNVLEAPRIAALFFLVCICAYAARPRHDPPTAAPAAEAVTWF